LQGLGGNQRERSSWRQRLDRVPPPSNRVEKGRVFRSSPPTRLSPFCNSPLLSPAAKRECPRWFRTKREASALENGSNSNSSRGEGGVPREVEGNSSARWSIGALPSIPSNWKTDLEVLPSIPYNPRSGQREGGRGVNYAADERPRTQGLRWCLGNRKPLRRCGILPLSKSTRSTPKPLQGHDSPRS